MSAGAADDASVTVAALRARVAAFVAERDWAKFHAPKNLAMALACEAAELMEPYLWVEASESSRLTDDPARRAKIEAEVADVAMCLLNLCNVLGVDLASALERKLVDAAAKYPAEVVRGFRRPGRRNPAKVNLATPSPTRASSAG